MSQPSCDPTNDTHRRTILSLDGLSGNERTLAENLNQLTLELQAAEEALCRAVDRTKADRRSLCSMQGVAAAVCNSLDVTAVCQSMAQALADDLGTPACSLMILDDETATLRLAAGATGRHHPPAAEPRVGQTLHLGDGVAGQVAATGTPIVIDDVLTDPRWRPGEDRVRVRSIGCFPLFGEGRIVGVTNVSFPEPGRFDPELVKRIQTVTPITGQLIGLALQRERLLAVKSELEEDVRAREETMRETQSSVAGKEKLAALGETVSGLAHEINNRLLPVTVYTEALLEADLPDDQADKVRVIADAVVGVKGILDSLLGFARQRKLRKEVVDLNRLIERILAVLGLSLQRDGIQVDTDFDPSLTPTLVDPMQIEQVLINLLRNAQHAIRGHAAPNQGRISVQTRRAGDIVLIKVHDNGCGIPVKNLRKIMQPFFSTKPPGEGTGLGLAVCYGIMKEHDGSIVVASAASDTSFTLRFPFVAAGNSKLEASSPALPAVLDTPEHRLRVLLIDDEPLLLRVLGEVLQGRLDLDIANSGAQALELLQRRDYDVIVSDWRMPGMTGRDIYEWVREHRPGLERRVIIATGDTFDPATHDFLAAGRVACVPKPFTIKSLMTCIQKVAAEAPEAVGVG